MSNPGPLSVVKEGDVTVVVFGPAQRHLDEVGLEAIQNQLVEIAQEANPPKVVLDMAVTEFFGSSFIEILFKVWKQLNTKPNSKFAISGLQEYCLEVLEITHLDKLWPMYATRAEAVAAAND
jgi:anti-sigma B factor antagonist